jgi:hypothetical protein
VGVVEFGLRQNIHGLSKSPQYQVRPAPTVVVGPTPCRSHSTVQARGRRIHRESAPRRGGLALARRRFLPLRQDKPAPFTVVRRNAKRTCEPFDAVQPDPVIEFSLGGFLFQMQSGETARAALIGNNG